MPETYRYKDRKKLRCGYTTGACAAAAAGAAARILVSGEILSRVQLQLPGGQSLSLPAELVACDADRVSCGVRKDGGDDRDVTHGALIVAEVKKEPVSGIRITGGPGVGIVTAPGLEQPPGSYAINRVPRQMIKEAVKAAAAAAGYKGGFLVTVSVPEGEALAARTFNPSLGIKGGISILGTSGIVEPMSEQALVDTIKLEMNMQAARGRRYCILTPGNYGLDYLTGVMGLDRGHAIKCGNFIGDAIDMAPSCHMKGLLLTGHLGKLVKLGAGMMNTHSRYGDGRMEVLCACALEAGGDLDLLKGIMDCVSTDAAVSLLREAQLAEAVMDILMRKIAFHLQKRVYEGIRIGAVVFSHEHGLLGQTKEAAELVAQIRREA